MDVFHDKTQIIFHRAPTGLPMQSHWTVLSAPKLITGPSKKKQTNETILVYLSTVKAHSWGEFWTRKILNHDTLLILCLNHVWSLHFHFSLLFFLYYFFPSPSSFLVPFQYSVHIVFVKLTKAKKLTCFIYVAVDNL